MSSRAFLWPLEGGRSAWPVYRAEQEHIDFGEQAGWDFGNQEGIAWIAPGDGMITQAFSHPQAGLSVVLECDDIRFHYCHGQALEVSVRQQVQRGDTIGHVGHTGWTIPDDERGAHLHLWVEKWMPD